MDKLTESMKKMYIGTEVGSFVDNCPGCQKSYICDEHINSALVCVDLIFLKGAKMTEKSLERKIYIAMGHLYMKVKQVIDDPKAAKEKIKELTPAFSQSSDSSLELIYYDLIQTRDYVIELSKTENKPKE